MQAQASVHVIPISDFAIIRRWAGEIVGHWHLAKRLIPSMRVSSQTSAVAPEPRRFLLARQPEGGWVLTSEANPSVRQFNDLPSALAFARAAAESKEADIELWVDGFYIFVHQPTGWPHAVCAPSSTN
jgi:hypothetical protein